jgi:Sulfotransferase family
MAKVGPAWLGIGAQLCGTNWFTKLLIQHPEVSLSIEDRADVRTLYGPRPNLDRYRGLFDTGDLSGEFTPYYLRSPLAPRAAAAAALPSAPIVVLLRDPVERYKLAMQHYESKASESLAALDRQTRVRLVGSDAAWGGMYATHLAAWRPFFGDRILVIQYETLERDAASAVGRVWAALGLDPVPLRDADEPPAEAADVEWEWPPGLQETLRRYYRPDVDRLRKQWGVDPGLWANFA